MITTVAITLSPRRLGNLATLLQQAGFEVWPVPLVQTQPLTTALEPALQCPWWLFSSSAAVEAVAQSHVRWQQQRIGVVGQSTAQTVVQAGAQVSVIAYPPSAQGLAQAVLAKGVSGPVALLQGNRALPWLREGLRRGGLEVRVFTVYRSLALAWPAQLGAPDIAVLGSPSAVQQLPQEFKQHTRCVALGPTTAQALKQAGWMHHVAKQPYNEAVFAAVMRCQHEVMHG